MRRYVIFLLLLFLLFLKIRSFSTHQIAVVFLLYLILLEALQYQSRELNCTLGNCSLENNEKSLPDTPKEYVCRLSKKPVWRKAYIAAMIVFTVLLYTVPDKMHVVVTASLISLACFYFLLNFESYHYYEIACKKYNNKYD